MPVLQRPIHLFCLLIFMPSFTEIQTTCTFSRLFCAYVIIPAPHTLSRTQFAEIIGANRAGKRASSLLNCIPVTDDIKINEQNKSIGIGPLYLQTEFETFSLLLQEVMLGLNSVGYRTLQCWHGTMQDPNMYFTVEKWCGMQC